MEFHTNAIVNTAYQKARPEEGFQGTEHIESIIVEIEQMRDQAEGLDPYDLEEINGVLTMLVRVKANFNAPYEEIEPVDYSTEEIE